MRHFSMAPQEMLGSLWRNRGLIFQMSKREVIGRYRGSYIGVAWSFLNPLLMLAVYTFVFSVVFQARWGVNVEESKTDFAIVLFVGLIIHGLFAECINRSPHLIISNVNYVKKVVFPLEILPWVTLGSALFHAVVSLVVLLVAQLIINSYIPPTALLFPLVIFPLILWIIGLAWFLAGLGVFLRDVGQVTVMLTTILLFISAVFFPISSLPEKFQYWLKLNPLAYIIEEGRNVLVFGVLPDLHGLLLALGLGAVFAWLGFAWFQKIRKGFADVL